MDVGETDLESFFTVLDKFIGLFVHVDSCQSYFPDGEKCGDKVFMPNSPLELPFNDSVGLSDSDGFIRFSFWRRLQYHTLTTSFSIPKLSANEAISSLVGFGFIINALSKETLMLVSIDVRFFRLLPIFSGVFNWLVRALAPKMLWWKRIII